MNVRRRQNYYSWRFIRQNDFLYMLPPPLVLNVLCRAWQNNQEAIGIDPRGLIPQAGCSLTYLNPPKSIGKNFLF